MGVTGPIPKRSDQLIRRNVQDVPVDKVTAIGAVRIPDLAIEDPHPLVVDMYESMKHSAQRRFFEPTDWQLARFTLHQVNAALRRDGDAISAMKLAALNTMLSNLLMTEGDRRRVRLEIERTNEAPAEVVQLSDVFKKRLAGG